MAKLTPMAMRAMKNKLPGLGEAKMPPARPSAKGMMRASAKKRVGAMASKVLGK